MTEQPRAAAAQSQISKQLDDASRSSPTCSPTCSPGATPESSPTATRRKGKAGGLEAVASDLSTFDDLFQAYDTLSTRSVEKSLQLYHKEESHQQPRAAAVAVAAAQSRISKQLDDASRSSSTCTAGATPESSPTTTRQKGKAGGVEAVESDLSTFGDLFEAYDMLSIRSVEKSLQLYHRDESHQFPITTTPTTTQVSLPSKPRQPMSNDDDDDEKPYANLIPISMRRNAKTRKAKKGGRWRSGDNGSSIAIFGKNHPLR